VLRGADRRSRDPPPRRGVSHQLRLRGHHPDRRRRLDQGL
ncbi:MAG: hypothetical protein AVDCRST_MAG73-2219, partial [uncultured Thermomicrobiales bacterium]